MEHNHEQHVVWSDEMQLLDWNRLSFQDQGTPESSSDVLRRKLAALFVSSTYKNSNRLPLQFSLELERIHRKYVECMDEKKGVNNFADSVQRLIGPGCSTDSREWKSELTAELILRHPALSLKQQQLDFTTIKFRKETPSQLLGQKPLERQTSGQQQFSSIEPNRGPLREGKQFVPTVLDSVGPCNPTAFQTSSRMPPNVELRKELSPSSSSSAPRPTQGRGFSSSSTTMPPPPPPLAAPPEDVSGRRNPSTFSSSSSAAAAGGVVCREDYNSRPTSRPSHTSAFGGESHGKGSERFRYADQRSNRKRQRGWGREEEEEGEGEGGSSDPHRKSNAFVTARDQFHTNQRKQGGSTGGSTAGGGGGGGGGYGRQQSSSSAGGGGGGGWEQYGQQQPPSSSSSHYYYNSSTGGGGGGGNDPSSTASAMGSYGGGGSKRSLGTRRGPGSKFVPPVKRDQEEEDFQDEIRSRVLYGGPSKSPGSLPPELEGDERLKNIEPKMIELITNEIMDHGSPVQWDDVAGLEFAKATIKEIVVWPMLRPDIFTGLRGPPKGLLLFGPPGTGKTLIGKCVASQVKATFFSISASSLTSKWVGEGEKMVRALFAVARCYQPAVVFIDEIDSLLSQRSDTEHESSRRIKTEFLVQLDGATTSSEDSLLVIGATNRPQEIDEAARRRLVKRLYIPLPDGPARRQIILNLMRGQKHSLDPSDLDQLCQRTEGYSGADMANLCKDAAYWPLRSVTDIASISADQVRAITLEDFVKSLATVRPSVSSKDLDIYIEWNNTYGCGK